VQPQKKISVRGVSIKSNSQITIWLQQDDDSRNVVVTAAFKGFLDEALCGDGDGITQRLVQSLRSVASRQRWRKQVR
jgi:hypothetical protein